MVLADANQQYGSGHRRDNNTARTGGKIGLTLFFLVFFLMGSFFELMIVREFLTRIKRCTWQEAPCAMLQSQVEETGNSDRPYALQVKYEYQYEDRSYQADSYAMDYRGSDSYDKTTKLAHRYAPGSQQRCYVNPKRPQQAVLVRGSLWFGLLLLFPLIFVVIGLGGMIGIWRTASNETRLKRIAIRGKQGPVIAAAFFGIFALVGTGALIPLFIMPMIHVMEARDWASVPCHILRSDVRSHDSDDSTTYSVHILYEYEFNGETLRTDRYGFMGGSSSGYKGKRLIVDRYPVGSKARCWVDPMRPIEAVLCRGLSPIMWVGLIPAAFILVGVGGVIAMVRRHGRQRNPKEQADWLRDTPPIERASASLCVGHVGPEAGPVELKPKHSPIGKFMGIFIFAIIWNAVVAFMVMTRLPNGPASPVPLVMVVVFAGIGMVCIVGVIYQFLAMFNPLPHLRLSAAQVALGDRLTVDWQVAGRVDRLVRLTLTLTGKETAQYRRGTRTCTAQRIFHQTDLIELSDPLAMQRGSTALSIPAHSMHSFHGDSNHIVWSLTLHGDIPRWPDMKETFEIVVPPMRPEQITQLPPSDEEELVWAIPVESNGETIL